mgnify:CR=1 FL=1|jgi:hypothetical protein|tara:strand:+ start:405 stop:818 length:414 start_codon:yes stop_codon:yes gene_type:complete
MSLDDKTNALKKVWWVERDSIGIASSSDTDETATYVSVGEVKTVNVHAVKHDEDFVATTGGDGSGGIRMDEEPAIPSEFHDALAQYAIAKGYELSPEGLQSAAYFRNLWNMCVNEAKQYANQDRLGGQSYSIQQHDF